VEDLGAVVLCDRRGIVIGVVVNNDEFVDELLVVAYRFEYRADGVRFVLRGNNDRHRGLRLEHHHLAQVELVSVQCPGSVRGRHHPKTRATGPDSVLDTGLAVRKNWVVIKSD